MTFDLEERVERAKALFSEGYNCCQAVFLAYSDLFEIEKGLAEALSCGFGGGQGLSLCDQPVHHLHQLISSILIWF